MIIWQASYPRSGMNYFQVLLWHFFRISSQTIYLQEELDKRDMEASFMRGAEELYGEKCRVPVVPAEDIKDDDVYVVKTHELPQDNFPAVYLVRDGRDSLISYAHFIKEVEQSPAAFDSILHDLIMNPGYFGGWSAHVSAWTLRQQGPTAIVKFEELVQTSSPEDVLKHSFARIGCELPEPPASEPPPAFSRLHETMPEIFRKGQIGNWQQEMSANLHELFWQRHGDAMQAMGYSR